MSKPKETRVGCYAVMHENNRVLLCRLSDGLEHRGRWTLPGGGLEFGESLEEAMVREVLEETGLQVQSSGLISFHSRVAEFDEKSLHLLQFLFGAEVKAGELTNEIDGTTDLVEWVEIDSLNDKNAVDIVHHALKSILG
ncbi:MAG: NUDIX domain-containing protein [Armatimonadetes bacterium]|nr:NUDIX domain-containing protein [Armatimonadota bacterium]MBS1703632.1 NUDIX domain-containing protein [Armatimonadota bacterium]MBS1728358.1 NUDIX domain-containing protein [Armatimonadota bacterium]